MTQPRLCLAVNNHFMCTRSLGHRGDHMVENGKTILAVWPNADDPASNETNSGLSPRVTVGYFRHPDYSGQDVDPECGHRWHDHGWIDLGYGEGLTVCPKAIGSPFAGQSVTEAGLSWLRQMSVMNR